MNADATLPKKKEFSWFRVIVAVFLIAGLILFLVIVNKYPFVNKASDQAHAEVHVIQAALDGYIAEFGKLPNEGPGGIMAALRGRNPQQKAFIEFPAYRFNSQGDLLDPWMHPYRIIGFNPKGFGVYSGGENRIDERGAEGSDDIVSWR